MGGVCHCCARRPGNGEGTLPYIAGQVHRTSNARKIRSLKFSCYRFGGVLLAVRSIAAISARRSALPTSMVVAKLSARVGPISRASIAAVMVAEFLGGFNTSHSQRTESMPKQLFGPCRCYCGQAAEGPRFHHNSKTSPPIFHVPWRGAQPPSAPCLMLSDQ